MTRARTAATPIERGQCAARAVASYAAKLGQILARTRGPYLRNYR
jgi:hypothetical protein